MRVLLIQPKALLDVKHQPVPPLGLIAIGSYLKEKGYTVKIIDRNIDRDKLQKKIEVYKPDLIGISVITGPMILDAIEVSQIAKEYKLPVVWGGVHPSLLPKQVLKNKYVDYVIIGDGEVTMHDLLKTLESKMAKNKIKGLGYVENGDIFINKKRPFTNPSKLPSTDWSLVNIENYFQGFGSCSKLIRIYSSKGCPGMCTFCYNQSFHGRKWRGRTPEQIVDEVQLLTEKYNVDGIGFTDELWSPNKKRMYEICKLLIERDIKVLWYFNARVDQYNREDLELLYEAGCRWILFGIESGSLRILNEIKKGISLNQVKNVFDLCNEIGISTIASFIIGFPGETKKDLKLTAEFAISIDATFYDFTRYMCYPGTKLYDMLIEEGLFKEPKSLKEWAEVSSWDRFKVNFSKIDNKDLEVYNDYFSFVNIKNMLTRDQFNTIMGYIKKFKIHKRKRRSLSDIFISINEIARIFYNLITNRKILKYYELPLISKEGITKMTH